jgi:2'-5' RNA ligase
MEFTGDEVRKKAEGLLNLCEYLLIISPDSSTLANIAVIKDIFKTKYECTHAANLIPHITLINFVQLEMNETRITNYLKNISKSINTFDVQLNGFGQFPTHTIYINVLTKEPIVTLVKKIKSSSKKFLQLTKVSKPIFITKPHLTVARAMKPTQFNTAWNDWKDERFVATFQAKEMLLLKQKIKGRKYEAVEAFTFSATGNQDVQLELKLF